MFRITGLLLHKPEVSLPALNLPETTNDIEWALYAEDPLSVYSPRITPQQERKSYFGAFFRSALRAAIFALADAIKGGYWEGL